MVVSKAPTHSGVRALSSAEALASMAKQGANFMIDGTENTITLAQALWDAGAMNDNLET